MSRRVRLTSGLIGWRDRLRHNYADLEEFKAFSGLYDLAARLGYTSAESSDGPDAENMP